MTASSPLPGPGKKATSAREREAQARLADLAEAAAREAGGVPSSLLGDYLQAVSAVAVDGGRLGARELADYRSAGARAAEAGVPLRALADLYLSATWRLWQELPRTVTATAVRARAAGLAVLRAADDAVASAAEGFEEAHRAVARREAAERSEFIDDLLSGRAARSELGERAERFGVRVAATHRVYLLRTPRRLTEGDPLVDRLDRVAATAAPSALVTAKGGRLVIVAAEHDGNVAERLARELSAAVAADPVQVQAPAGGSGRAGRGAASGLGASGAGGAGAGAGGARPWRLAVSRPRPGPAGVVDSFEEAASAMEVADRLRLREPVVFASDMLVYHVLIGDRVALAELVEAVLVPLEQARGGAEPLLDTLDTFFATGEVAAETARRLHLSVRAVTYRLARIAALTGHDINDAAQALTLRVAVTGARLLDWPAQPLPTTR